MKRRLKNSDDWFLTKPSGLNRIKQSAINPFKMAEKIGEPKKEKLPSAEVEKEIPRPWEGIELEEEGNEAELR